MNGNRPFYVRHAWRYSIGCKSRTGVDGDEPLAEDKGVPSDRGSEGSRTQKIDPTYRNRI